MDNNLVEKPEIEDLRSKLIQTEPITIDHIKNEIPLEDEIISDKSSNLLLLERGPNLWVNWLFNL